MQLLSLSISGFKSFAKPTRLEFSSGITAVVGPNGCGKSNVVDSLRWVLGEQRSSVLRGERMENIIFNGTAIRKPAGMAEVRITLDNRQGRLNVPQAEVEIARRLFRDGTSEYLLNANECRLKDITDLLHDSGMSPNLYTILELKMVEDILREDGEGRRALFEEAAGVAKYKLRRRQALQKLKQTEDDLLRLADIVAEVERQVSSLKRQAMRAKKYEELSKLLSSLDTALVWREYLRLQSELDPLEKMRVESSDSSEAVRAALRVEEAKLLQLRNGEMETDREAALARRNLATIVAEISTLEAEEAGLRAKDQAARQTIERTRREKQLLEDKRSLLDIRLTDLLKSKSFCDEELQKTESVLLEAVEKLKESEVRLAEVEADANSYSEQLLNYRRKVLDRQKELSKRAMERAGLVSRAEMLQNERQSIATERDAIQEKIRILKERFSAFDEEEGKLADEDKRLQSEIASLREDLTQQEERLRVLTSLAEAAKARLELLATLEEKGPRSSAALRALKTKPVAGLMDLLGDTIDVDDMYRRALQAALGPAAYYYLTESVEAAFAAMDTLRRERAGQTTFLPVTEFMPESSDPIQAPEGTIGTALSVIGEASLNSVIVHFLSRVVIVKDWSSALEHHEWAKAKNCTLVTLDGQWIGNRGLLYGGSSDTEVPADLGLARQMVELRQKLETAKVDREATTTAIRNCRNQLAVTEQNLSGLRRKIAEFNVRRSEVREQQVKMETLFAAMGARAESIVKQIETLESGVTDVDRLLLDDEKIVQEAENDLKEAETSGSDLVQRVSEAQRETAAAREAKHTRERSRDEVRHRLELLIAEEQRIRESLSEIESEIQIAETGAEQAANDLVNLERRLKEIDGTSVEKYRLRDESAQTADRVQLRLEEARNLIAAQEERLQALRESHTGELEGSKKIELEAARLRGELDALVHNTRTQTGLDLTDADFAEKHAEKLSVEATPELLQECKQKIERLGPINSLAIEEFTVENARLEGMLSQREDLLKAKTTLEETIARINEMAQSRFLHTFEAVRANFQRLFQEFFVAGEADLILSGQDLLDADITLWANPSGKRLKSLSLMSGGEKTMTAIALLFALYQVKPSPFCVFDEVDAPLDDANIDRFNRMIRIHSDATQFILITHNRRTMEIADNLYGVTMEEEGISKLVSVRLMAPTV